MGQRWRSRVADPRDTLARVPDNGIGSAVHPGTPNFRLRFRPYLEEHAAGHFGSLLDIGGGPAGYGVLYREIADRVVVCDLNDVSESYAGTGIEFVTCDVTKSLPFPDQTFDLVCSHSVFEHLDGVPDALDAIDRVLKPRGLAFITIRPMYYSAQGFHHREFSDWEHLQGADQPVIPDGHRGSFLNRMTYAEFLSYVGRQGWRIRDFTPKFHTDRQPSAELTFRFSEVDLMGLEFFGLFEKLRHRPH
jgi:SAM-dependent methyltransferase